MRVAETVRGPVAENQLGQTLMHEHIFIREPELEANYPDSEADDERLLEVAISGLESLFESGVTTVVDLTVLGLGRDIRPVREIASRTRVNIVVATGYYTKRDLPPYFRNRGPGRRIDVAEPLETMFKTDIYEGIAGTGIKAGMIKVVTDEEGVTPDVERVLSAASTVHLETDVPITTHTNAAHFTGRLQQAFFRSRDVDLSNVVIGHCGDTDNLEYLKELMDNGSTIGMDRFGVPSYLSDARRIDTVVSLCASGYADRMVLSHDVSFFSISFPPRYRKTEMPDWGFEHLPSRILPELKRRGVTDSQIAQMMVENPARILCRDRGK